MLELASKINDQSNSTSQINGICYKDESGDYVENNPQEIISDLNILAPYDYTLFEDQVFFRPYNGDVVRAVDTNSQEVVFTLVNTVLKL